MFVADGYISNLPDVRMQTDSLKVYSSIFEKYGYTEEQFLAAQNRLLEKPERMEKVITSVKEMLEKRRDILAREVAVLDSIAEAQFALAQDSIAARENFLDSLSFACILDTVCLTFSADTFAVKVLDHKADTSSKVKKDSVKPSKTPVEIVQVESRTQIMLDDDFADEELKELEELEEASKNKPENQRKLKKPKRLRKK